MELLDAVESLVKNPLLDTVILEDCILNKSLIESYKNSDTHKIRKLTTNKRNFSDMTHVIPYPDMTHVFTLT
ncbi:TPA: hypothetical protein ACTUT5_003234 [Legionella anisa]|uniref:Uncharacterized protein n=1 Tax=Legionella waltersii TaxID=66969 RepID=A0A0W1AGY6_9GAMM|nr:hypothetical protein [Legionella anisa]KTD80464.1 hypothetical protein Lwal_1161 [Legionella waltersii]HAT6365260.1 hypothetical protein [Legionella pneumophila]MBN5936092.1 hypothetical protein [Legionella anisa]SNV09854.1 Uncharacterised protein [Legionella waltersii]HAT6368286.1 hypothetical protein [Legionella pneumophila]